MCGSVLWEIFCKVHRRFMDHTRVFGDDYRLELLGRQVKTEKQWGCLLAGHDQVQDVWLKEEMGVLAPHSLTGPGEWGCRRNGADWRGSIVDL